MKKVFTLIAMVVLCVGLFAASASTPTLSTPTQSTVKTFSVYSGTSIVGTAGATTDSLTVTYIISPTFTDGHRISGKPCVVQGVVNTAIYTWGGSATVGAATAIAGMRCKLYGSIDNSNWGLIATYSAYDTAAGTAGTVITVPVDLSSMYAPYYRVVWQGLSAANTEHTRVIRGGKITTSILVGK